METIDYNGVTLHRWNCGPSTFLVRPELGARLMNWNLQMSDGTVRDVIHWPENADFDTFAKVRGGNPILFPFSARSFNKGEIGSWPDQDGTVRPMPMHGFTRNGAFEIVALNEQGFTVELKPTEADREAYPYDYRFTVRYEFSELSLKVTLSLENLDTKPMLWSAGHHFYFALPWREGTTRGDYRFKIPAKECYTQADDGSLIPVKPFKKESSFGNPENSDRIFTKLNGDLTTFGPNDGNENVKMRILQDTDTASPSNAVVIWTEFKDSPFYCVEPWMGPPNSAEHGKGLHTVEPGQRSSFAVEVSV
jgi:galactose mutarotase-like enzyme